MQRRVWCGLFVLLSTGFLLAQDGVLTGRVEDASTGQELDALTVMIDNAVFQRSVTVDSPFRVEKIPPGSYRLRVLREGFETREQRVMVTAESTPIVIQLEPMALELRNVVVAPSTFSLTSKPLASGNYLDRETIANTPHFGDDLYRALTTLPGTSGNDISAAFNVRSGAYREVNVTLDGMTLIDPFHLKDFTGVFSFLDPESLGSLNLTTGGYSAAYGNAMSGVLEMEAVEPYEQRNSATLSFGNVAFRTEDTFADGLGSYLFSGRRGYLDILLSFAEDEEEEEESDVTYWDSHGRVRYLLSPGQALSFNYLVAADDFLQSENEENEIENTDSTYDDTYVWLTLDSLFGNDVELQTLIGWTDIRQGRSASSFGDVDEFDLADRRKSEYLEVKQNGSWSINDRALLRFGWNFRDVEATYDYRSTVDNGEPIGGPDERVIETALKPSGEEVSAYLSGRFRLGDSWLAELGVRYDDQSVLDENQVSPRLNLAYTFADNSTLRFAYGIYHQAERIHELQIADGETFFAKPEQAVHWLLGYERRFGNGLDFRIEAYLKDMDDLRTRYENLVQSLVLYPGLSGDRVALPVKTGEVSGVELVMKQNLGGRWSWFLNYAWSQAEDKLADGTVIPRQWEQEHTLNASVNYRFGRKWNVNLAWIYHTGWHTTPIALVADESAESGFRIEPGAVFSDTFPDYHRLDVRVNRRVFFNRKRSQSGSPERSFELFLDVFNVYNRKNIRGYEDVQIVFNDAGDAEIQFEEETWLPLLPTFGLTWRF